MGYETNNHSMYRIEDDGTRTIMANFAAEITKETRFVDGIKTDSVLTIEGTQRREDNNGIVDLDKEPEHLPAIEISAESFAGLTWVTPKWGIQAIVYPGTGIKDDLRTAIQLRSKPQIETIYKHIGWTKINGKRAYLHAGGAITAKGNDASVSVRLAPELQRYNLQTEEEPAFAITQTLGLLRLTKPDVMWPLLAATFAPLFGPVDFGIHVTGRTGTFKSELMSLMQCHYGPQMDARHLPGSWSSTANALEAQAFLAKDAAFVIDDFVPVGSTWQQRAYQTNADKIVRSQGNQAGRARLTDTSSLQTTMYPRGIIMSTGEDTPEGHSVRARLLIMELSSGDITPQRLTAAQKPRMSYVGTTAALIQYLAENPIDLNPASERYRTKYIEIGHSRTPSMIGRLLATIDAYLAWAAYMKVIPAKSLTGMQKEAHEAILTAGKRQQGYLEAADPCERFIEALQSVFAKGTGHIRGVKGGVPRKATLMGWVPERYEHSEEPSWKSRGPCIGWINWDKDELYLEHNAAYAAAKKELSSELTLNKNTMVKRLLESGRIIRTEGGRDRNTVRITADGNARTVIVLSASATFDTKETPSDDDEGIPI